jgi:hypothetical protein
MTTDCNRIKNEYKKKRITKKQKKSVFARTTHHSITQPSLHESFNGPVHYGIKNNRMCNVSGCTTTVTPGPPGSCLVVSVLAWLSEGAASETDRCHK